MLVFVTFLGMHAYIYPMGAVNTMNANSLAAMYVRSHTHTHTIETRIYIPFSVSRIRVSTTRRRMGQICLGAGRRPVRFRTTKPLLSNSAPPSTFTRENVAQLGPQHSCVSPPPAFSRNAQNCNLCPRHRP